MTNPDLSRLIKWGTDTRSLVAVDPGEHIGYAWFLEGELIQVGEEHKTFAQNLQWLDAFMIATLPNVVVCESYHIYARHSRDHINSDVPTLRVIGAVQMLQVQRGFKLVMQTPAQGKGFVTDDKLTAWGFRGIKSIHARDALRHALHFLIFGGKRI